MVGRSENVVAGGARLFEVRQRDNVRRPGSLSLLPAFAFCL